MPIPGSNLVKRLIGGVKVGTKVTVKSIGATPRLTVGGRVQALAPENLVSLKIEERAEGLTTCEAELLNFGVAAGGSAPGFLHFTPDSIDFADELVIQAGTHRLFDGRVSGIEGRFPAGEAPTVVVLAEDKLQELRMTRRTRTFENVSDADVIRQIAADHSLQAGVDVSGGTHRQLAQLNQSDLAFLRDRALAVGTFLWLDGTTLHAAAVNSATEVELRLGQDLVDLTVFADLAHQRTKVVVSGWDVESKQAIKFDATAAVVRNGKTGAQLLEAGFGPRVETVVTTQAATREEAQDLGQALVARRARRFVTGRGSATGDAALGLHVGRPVKLSGLGPLFSGTYTVTEVRHVFDTQHGVRTELGVERTWVGRP